VGILGLCAGARDYRALSSSVGVLCKRRGQSQKAITDLVAFALSAAPGAPTPGDRVEVLEAVKAVTDGRLFVEVERARATLALARLAEGAGRVAEASETLQEVQIETFGSMDKAEKADFIVEQARLALRSRDVGRAAILAAKMNKKVLDEPGFEGVRVRYYRLLGAIARAQHDALGVARHAQAVRATRGLPPADAAAELARAMTHLALAPWSNDAADGMHRALADPAADGLPGHAALLRLLTTPEFVPWPLPGAAGAAVAADDAFRVDLLGVPLEALPPDEAAAAGAAFAAAAAAAVAAGAPPSAALGGDGPSAASKVGSSLLLAEDEPRAASWWPALRKRVAQHNLRTAAGAFSRARLGRLGELVGLDRPTLEAALAELVSAKAVVAKMDRPAGTVTFGAPPSADAALGAWGADVEGALALVERLHHLVTKEAQVHGVTLEAPPGGGPAA